LLGTVFEQKDNDPTRRLLCLKFNFQQNDTVAKNLKDLKSSLT
jgi:hypothetical protein